MYVYQNTYNAFYVECPRAGKCANSNRTLRAPETHHNACDRHHRDRYRGALSDHTGGASVRRSCRLSAGG